MTWPMMGFGLLTRKVPSTGFRISPQPTEYPKGLSRRQANSLKGARASRGSLGVTGCGHPRYRRSLWPAFQGSLRIFERREGNARGRGTARQGSTVAQYVQGGHESL